MTRRSITLLMGLALLIGAFFAFDLHHLLTFEGLAARRAALLTLKAAHPIAAALIFFMVYTLTTGLSLPGASALALLAGALFGLPLGVALVSFASTLGATLAFLSARWLLRDAVARRWPERLALIDEGVAREGALYLFGLRLTPVFPFFIINLALGLTRMRVWTFAWVSQLGMLLGTILFVNAGTALAQLKGPSGILSPRLLLAFTLLGITPLLTKRLMSWLRARQVEAA